MTSLPWHELTAGGNGSFRGIQFRCISIQISGGRRTTPHETYLGEVSSVEDTGRVPRRFRVAGLVLGDTYYETRAALADAFESSDGRSVLSYPILGDVDVEVLGEYSITDSAAFLGAAEFDCTFVESIDAETPVSLSAITDAASSARAAAIAAEASAAGDMQNRVSALNQLQASINKAVGELNDAATAIRTINGRIQAAIGIVTGAIDSVNNILNTSAALIRAPSDMFAAINSSIASVFSSIQNIDSSVQSSIAALSGAGPSAIGRTVSRFKLNLMRRVMSQCVLFGDANRADEHRQIFGTIPADAGGDEAVQSNLEGIRDSVKLSAVINATLSLVTDESLRFDTSKSVDDFDDIYFSLIDDLMLRAGDELFYDLSDIKSSIAIYLEEVRRGLPSESTFTTTSVVSSLYLSNLLYGSPDFELDVSLGNSLENPGVIPAGTVIRVLR